jgi:signal-transduction protein with cAMP-binding, CBS, and nucleotidyltransferase domain
MGMSLRYQAKRILFEKKSPDNFIDTTNLTTIEIITLKQIFSLIEEFRQGFRNLPLRILGKSREI